MNLVGKIFVVLILVMSLVFASFAVAVYATHKNWKMIVENTDTSVGPLGLRAQLDNARSELDRMRQQREDLERQLDLERDRKAQAVAKLEHHVQALRQEVETLTAENQDVRAQATKNAASLEVAQRNVQAALEERDRLRDEIIKTIEQRDGYFKEIVKLTDELNDAQAEYKRLKETNAQLVEQIAQMQYVFNELQINWKPIAEGQDPPRVQGLVLAARENKWVEVSLGADDGLRAGHELDVSRGGKYIGRVRIIKTTPDRSVAQVLPDYLKAPVQEADRVRTKLAN